MAEIWEDAVEKLGKPFQEVGVDESGDTQTAKSDAVKTDKVTSPLKGGNSEGYIDIHIDGIEKTGTQVSNNLVCSETDSIHTEVNNKYDERTCDSVSEDMSNLKTVNTDKSDQTNTVNDCSDECGTGFCEDSMHGGEESDCSTDSEDEMLYHSADEGEEDDADEEHRQKQEAKLSEEEKKVIIKTI